ncbi:MAG: MBL fold metallo-hydrolase [Candidatus Helarchaeota archaeon]
MNKPENIHDDIYLIGGSGLSGPGDCLIYLICTKNGLVMIDCGVNNRSVEKLIKNIKILGFKPNDLNSLVLTHCHIDHVGGASELQRKFNIKIIAHDIEAPVIEGKKFPERIGAYFYGVEYDPCTVNIKLKGIESELDFGDKIIKFLFTPGHTPGGISPYIDVNNKRVLFGQDIHGPLMNGFGSNLDDYLNSMNKLLQLEADILCEGHFGIFYSKLEVSNYIKKYIKQYSK